MPDELLIRCSCVDVDRCHWCHGRLSQQEDLPDSEAWADYTVPVPRQAASWPDGRLHVIGHADCAANDPEVERA